MRVEASGELRGVSAAGRDEPPETAWLLAAQAGDRAAFARLVEVYWPRLFRWLVHLTRDRHLAEDLAQETFLKALAHLDRFRAGTNFRAWLFRIGHNAFANLHRSPGRRRAALPDDLAASAPGPVEAACSREQLRELAAAVEGLPTDFKAALLLRVDEGLSFRQIAEVLETTEETARWRVFKARQKLMDKLEPEAGT
ncbi:MAG: sigma-70 family RNA polymerase sigma factor [Gemmataceae bacterium]